MGRKLDLSGLTDNEAEHVLQVVQRDMTLRKKEEKRLSELKQELEEEGSRCLLLSRQRCFNQRCCIRCCSPFTFLLNPKRQCSVCHYNVCKACRVYVKQDKAWLCSACQKSRLLKTQSLEWFYTDVKRRFKRFGSAKVLKTLYRKHLAQHSAHSELTEGSTYEESVCNEGSVCGSDSTFYRQSEEHSMAETLTVALRVAEEAIDEAISEAEFDTASQEKQDEAHYLREHRRELIDELAKTIVQKIINRKKTLAEMRTEYDQDWPLGQNTDPHHPHHHPHHHQSTCDEASCSLTHQPGLWRSQSAFSLLSTDASGLIQESLQTLKKEGSGSTISAWKSVDVLDNAGVSSVLKSPDGNWIALQSTQLSRPTLLTQRKSQVYSALERESGVVSAYEGMDSEDSDEPEPDSSWGAALQQIHRKMTDCNLNLQDAQDGVASPLASRRGSRDALFSDSDGNRKPHKPLVALLKRKVPAEIRRPSAVRRTSIIDVDFNVEGATEEEEERSGVAAEPEGGRARRSRRKRKSKKVAASSSVSDLNKRDNESRPNSDALTSDTLTCEATTPEPFDLESAPTGHAANQTDEELELELQQRTRRVSAASDRENVLEEDRISDDDGLREDRRQGSEDGDDEEERLWKMEVDLDEGRMENERAEDDRDYEVDDEEMKHRLYRLVAQSRLTYFSSTDDELDRVGPSEGEWDEDNNEEEEEKTEGLTYKLCRLEKEVRATQFSSTEDELDRLGVDERRTEEERGSHEELAVKVSRLANQVQAVQCSSTEEELDRAGRGGDGEQGMDEETLWTLQAEKAVQAAQLRDLASLVSASQFSSTEDELDRVEQDEGEKEQEVKGGEMESSFETEEVWGGAEDNRRESFEDLDVNMFDLRDEGEETKSEDEKATDEDVLDDERQRETPETSEIQIRERVEDEITAIETHAREDKAETAKETQGGNERKSVVEAEKTEEMIDSNETRVERDNQPEAWTPDNSKDEKLKESKEAQESWEASADSEEDDAEFDRIISSMLMMTLEDMQAETAAENGRENKELPAKEGDGSIQIKEESGVTEKVVEAQGRYDSEETGSVEKVENATETNEQEEKDADPRDGISLDLEKNEAQQTCGKKEEEEQEEGSGKIAMEQKMMEEAAAECESKEKDEKLEETQEKRDEESSSLQEGFLSPEEIQHGSDAELNNTLQLMSTLLQQRYSAASLCRITTQVLKVLNATEDLLQGVEGGDGAPPSSISLPPNTDAKKLDQQFSRLEENVYVAAGSVFGLEAELSDLEECARGIRSSTSDMELSFLEEQVASAAARVQQSELQIGDISTRIAALKSAGLNVDTQSRFTKGRSIPVMPVTLDSARQLRRRLPAPPAKEDKET